MSLGSIPNDIRVPLVYIEIDNSDAVDGTPAKPSKILVLGQQLAGGSATPLTLNRITSDSQPGSLYGKGSMLAGMLASLRKANSYTETWALGISDLVAGAAASAEISVTGTASEAGTLYLLVAGEQVQVGVTATMTAAALTTAIIVAINATLTLPVTAVLKEGTTAIVVLTAKHKGSTGNDLDARINYYTGEVTPAGLAITISAFTGGSGTPDMSAVLAAIPDEWYTYIVMPFNDTASMNTLRDELVERWGPLKMIEGIAFTAYRGTHAATGSYGESRNDYLYSCMGTNKSPQPTWMWAANYAGISAYYLDIDPARPLQTLVLPGILPAAKSARWDMTERNLLLHDGIATHYVNASDECAIEREISMYRLNSFGDSDPSYLDITTPATLGYIRYSIKTRISQRYPRHKLADDDVLDIIDPSQPIVTPKLMRQTLLDLALEWERDGLIEGFDTYKDTLNVYRDTSDRNRLNVVCHPDIVNQLRIFASLIQFKL